MADGTTGTLGATPSSLPSGAPIPVGDGLEALVLDLIDPAKREVTLFELSKKREEFPHLAPLLWHSFGTMAALLQEIVGIYPSLAPPSLSPAASNRVCNALALLQCVASHPDTRALFLAAHIPLYLYPFLNTVNKSKPFEYLRLTSLGVIGALVKVRAARREPCGHAPRARRPPPPPPRSRPAKGQGWGAAVEPRGAAGRREGSAHVASSAFSPSSHSLLLTLPPSTPRSKTTRRW